MSTTSTLPGSRDHTMGIGPGKKTAGQDSAVETAAKVFLDIAGNGLTRAALGEPGLQVGLNHPKPRRRRKAGRARGRAAGAWRVARGARGFAPRWPAR